MKVEEDDFAGLEDFLPEALPDGAVPLAGVVVIEYVTPEGDTEHVYETLGDVRIVHALGLIEVGKFLLLDDMQGEDD